MSCAFDRYFAGPPALVFALWTRPQFVSIWFGSSHGFRVEVHELDPRPGGYWRFVNRRGDAVERPWGVYHEVEPARRLLYSYFYEGTDFRSMVSIDLAPEGAGTRMRFCQTGFPDAESHREHGFGWPVAFRLFEQALLAAHGIGCQPAGLAAKGARWRRPRHGGGPATLRGGAPKGGERSRLTAYCRWRPGAISPAKTTDGAGSCRLLLCTAQERMPKCTIRASTYTTPKCRSSAAPARRVIAASAAR